MFKRTRSLVCRATSKTVLAIIIAISMPVDNVSAEGDLEILVPRVLEGDWFPTSLDCGSAKSSVNGMYFGATGNLDRRDSTERCRFREWNAENPVLNSHSELGRWYFSAHCDRFTFNSSTARPESKSQMIYGRVSLRADQKTGTEYLVIDTQDNRGSSSVFVKVEPVNPRVAILQRCPSAGPATHFGWATPPQ